MEKLHESLSEEEIALAWVAIAITTLNDFAIRGTQLVHPEDQEVLSVSREDDGGQSKITVDLVWEGWTQPSTLIVEIKTEELDFLLSGMLAKRNNKSVPMPSLRNSPPATFSGFPSNSFWKKFFPN